MTVPAEVHPHPSPPPEGAGIFIRGNHINTRGNHKGCPYILIPLALWGGNMAKRPGWQTGRGLDMLTVWREQAKDVRGRAIDCGHFLAEEAPEETAREILAFLGGG